MLVSALVIFVRDNGMPFRLGQYFLSQLFSIT